MPENEVLLRFAQEGAEGAQQAVRGIEGILQTLRKAAQDVGGSLAETGKQTAATGGAFQGLRQHLQGVQSAFQQGQAAGASFNGVLGLVGSVVSAATSPLGLLTLGIGAAAGAMVYLSNSARAAYERVERLQVASGLSLVAAQGLRNAFEMAGSSAESLDGLLFRLGLEIETGGKAFERLGIAVRKDSGEVKEAGEIFFDVQRKIAGMGDASQQAAAAQELAGRMGRSYLPILTMQSSKLDELFERGKRNAAVTEELAERTRVLTERMADLAQKAEKTKMAFTEAVAIPVSSFLLDVVDKASHAARAWATFVAIVGASFSKERYAELMQYLKGLRDAAAQPPPKVVEPPKPADPEARKRLLESEIRLERMAVEASGQLGAIRLRAEADLAGQLLQIRTGSEQGAIQARIAANEGLLRLAKERYERELALEEDRARVLGGAVPREDRLRLETEYARQITALTAESAKDRLALERAAQADTARLLDERLTLEQHRSQIRLALVDEERNRLLVLNRAMVQDAVSAATRQAAIEQDAARRTRDERVSAIEREIEARRRLAETYPEDARLQAQTTQQIMGLNRQRLTVEIETNQKILESRQQMLDKLRQQAQSEAGAGEALMQRALARAEAQGRPISREDILAEQTEATRRARETMGEYRAGLTVAPARMREAMEVERMERQLAAAGTTAAGALWQLGAQQRATLQGPEAYRAYEAGQRPAGIAMRPELFPQAARPGLQEQAEVIQRYTMAGATPEQMRVGLEQWAVRREAAEAAEAAARLGGGARAALARAPGEEELGLPKVESSYRDTFAKVRGIVDEAMGEIERRVQQANIGIAEGLRRAIYDDLVRYFERESVRQ